MTTIELAKALAQSLVEQESREMIDDDLALRIALQAARIVGAELTRVRLAKVATKLPDGG